MFTVLLFFSSIVVCLILAVRSDKAYLFVLYELIYFFSPETKWWGAMIPKLSYSFYTVLLILIVAIMQDEKFGRNSPFKIKAFLYMYLMILLYAIAYFLTPYTVAHSIAFDAFLTLGVLVSIVYVISESKKSLNIIVNGYLVGATYLSFYIFQFGRNSGDRVEYIGMPDAPDANGIAAALAPALPIVLGYFWASKGWKKKILYAVAGIFIANAIILINSRGAFLGAALGTLYLLWKIFRGNPNLPETQNTKTKWSVVLLVFLGLSGGYVIADQSFIDRMLTIKEEAKGPSSEKESGATRTEYWKAAWRMAKDHPFGAGRGGFEFYAPSYIPEHIDTGGSKNRAVHSTWFEALSEIGYLGMLALILMMASTYSMIRRTSESIVKSRDIFYYTVMLSIMAGFISILVTITFVNRMRAEVLYWIIIFASVAHKLLAAKNEHKPAKSD